MTRQVVVIYDSTGGDTGRVAEAVARGLLSIPTPDVDADPSGAVEGTRRDGSAGGVLVGVEVAGHRT